MKTRMMLIGFILVALFSITGVAKLGVRDAESAMNTDLTPAPGAPVRKTVLNCVREELRRMHGLEVIFVVRQIKVKDGWAWIHVRPQSADGIQHYEDVAALLVMKDGDWTVAEMPCMEIDNPDCLDSPDYFTGLRKRFPDMPTAILPTARCSQLPLILAEFFRRS